MEPLTIESIKGAILPEVQKRLESDSAERAKLQARLDQVEKSWSDRVNQTMPGYADKENKERFSLPEYLRFVASKGNDRYAKLERSLLEEHNKKTGYRDAWMATRAAMGTTPDTLGGYVVATDLLGAEFIGSLEASVVVRRLGARSITGLRGPFDIPRKSAGATAAYTAENGDIGESDVELDQVKFTPRELAAAVRTSRQLLMMSNVSVDRMIRDDLALRFALKEDITALKGVGPNTPTGLITNPDVPTQSLAALGTSLDKLMDFENVVAENNGMGAQSKLGWAVRPAGWNVIRQVKDLDGRYMLQPDGTGKTPRMLLGWPVETTTQLAAGDAVYGNWDDLVIALWEALEFAVTTEGESTFLRNQALIRAIALHDMNVRQPKSFVKATDLSA